MSVPLKKQKEKYSYGDYRMWPDDEKWEIINGVPYYMSPAPARKHQEISMELCYQIRNYLKDKACKVYAAPFDVRFPAGDETDEDIETVVQPDITVVCDENKLDDWGCKGAPDFIVEILSPATAKRDLGEKFDLYEASGVKEYWVVFPLDKVIHVYLLNEDGKYEKNISYYEDNILPATVLEGLEVDLKQVFA